MRSSCFVVRLAGAALAVALASAPGFSAAQGAGERSGVSQRVEGPAGPPPAAGPPASPSLSGERPAGRTGVQDQQSSPATAERAAPLAAGASGRQAGGADRAAAGLPGRQAPPPTAAPASSPSGPRDLTAREREVAEVFGCPRKKVAVMLEAAVGEAQFSASLGLEREIIRYCRERWKEIHEMLKAEFDLAEVLREDHVARERAAIELDERRRVARAKVEGARLGAEAAAKALEERKLLAMAAPDPAETAEAPKVEPEPEPEPKPEPVVVLEEPEPETQEVYGWFSIIGRAGKLRAGVTDGEGKWWVREGDELPDGALVTRISARPLRVLFEDGPAAGLPYRGLR